MPQCLFVEPVNTLLSPHQPVLVVLDSHWDGAALVLEDSSIDGAKSANTRAESLVIAAAHGELARLNAGYAHARVKALVNRPIHGVAGRRRRMLMRELHWNLDLPSKDRSTRPPAWEIYL